jgi:osmotically inducible protein OsmC
MSVRKANAVWEGTLKEGKGTVSVGSGLFDGAPYSFSSRFEEGSGTNPEELLAAAYASCFSQAFSLALEQAGFPPQKIETSADLTLEKGERGFTISRVVLKTQVRVPGIDEDKFQELAEEAKTNCPVSRALTGVQKNVQAALTR